MLVFHGEQFGGVVDRAVAVVVVAHRAVEFVIAENAVERLGAGGVRPAGRGGDLHSGATTVAQARTSLPSTSTMQVSQVWIGPNIGR
jgi:hypothetical protein